MKPETNAADTPIGLYRDPESGEYLGTTEEAAAAAFIRAGWKLVEEGPEAALLTGEEIKARYENTPDHDVDESKTSGKKGK